MTDLPAMLQYGALGLLGVTLFGIYLVGKMLVGVISTFLARFATSFDDLVKTVKEIVPALVELKIETAGLRSDINSRPCIAKK